MNRSQNFYSYFLKAASLFYFISGFLMLLSIPTLFLTAKPVIYAKELGIFLLPVSILIENNTFFIFIILPIALGYLGFHYASDIIENKRGGQEVWILLISIACSIVISNLIFATAEFTNLVLAVSAVQPILYILAFLNLVKESTSFKEIVLMLSGAILIASAIMTGSSYIVSLPLPYVEIKKCSAKDYRENLSWEELIRQQNDICEINLSYRKLTILPKEMNQFTNNKNLEWLWLRGNNFSPEVQNRIKKLFPITATDF